MNEFVIKAKILNLVATKSCIKSRGITKKKNFGYEAGLRKNRKNLMYVLKIKFKIDQKHLRPYKNQKC